MPILRQHDMLMRLDQAVDERHDLIAAFDGESAARAKVVLHVDNDKDGVIHHGSLHLNSRASDQTLGTAQMRHIEHFTIQTNNAAISGFGKSRHYAPGL